MKPRVTTLLMMGLAACVCLTAWAQGPYRGGNESEQGPPPMQPNHGPMDRAMHAGPPGRWWSDPGTAQALGLTAEQQHRMDELFQQGRLKLIDLSAALQKEEAIMEPLLEADRPDEAKTLVQIDRVAQARAELEKANARLLLGLRGVLTQEQWKKLQESAHGMNRRPPERGPGGPPPRPH